MHAGAFDVVKRYDQTSSQLSVQIVFFLCLLSHYVSFPLGQVLRYYETFKMYKIENGRARIGL